MEAPADLRIQHCRFMVGIPLATLESKVGSEEILITRNWMVVAVAMFGWKG